MVWPGGLLQISLGPWTHTLIELFGTKPGHHTAWMNVRHSPGCGKQGFLQGEMRAHLTPGLTELRPFCFFLFPNEKYHSESSLLLWLLHSQCEVSRNQSSWEHGKNKNVSGVDWKTQAARSPGSCLLWIFPPCSFISCCTIRSTGSHLSPNYVNVPLSLLNLCGRQHSVREDRCSREPSWAAH